METWKRNLAICWVGSFACVAGMALVMPFMPLYIEQLGVHDEGRVEVFSGLAFGVTFLLAAIVSPLWGRLADRHGRKLMLLRASLGMAVVTCLMGLATNVWQLVALRFLMGAVSGYISAAITLVATQTPRERSGWALGTLSTGHVSGGLIGPLLGGYLAETIGMRPVFFVTSAFLGLAFLLTWLFLVETFTPGEQAELSNREVWAALPDPRALLAVFATVFTLQVALLSIEPIITVYVRQLLGSSRHVALVGGAVVAMSGVANVIAAPRLGRLSDRFGPRRVLLVAMGLGALLYLPQAFAQNAWQLGALRFVFGLAAAGMLPSVNAMLRRLAPEAIAGRVFGYNQSAQYLGNISGPVMGGFVASHFGLRSVFFCTVSLLLLNTLAVWRLGVGREATVV